MNKAGSVEISQLEAEQAIKLRVLKLERSNGRLRDVDDVDFLNRSTVTWVVQPRPGGTPDDAAGPLVSAEVTWKE